MPISILMPALSPTMTEGTLVSWHKTEGETVSPGDVLAEIETDKATMEVEAVDEGILAKILIEEGVEGIEVNTPIAILLEEGESESDIKEKDLEQDQHNIEKAEEDIDHGQAEPLPVVEPSTGSQNKGDGSRVFASPLARRMASQASIPLTSITGSGPNGRIVKVDVVAAIATKTTDEKVAVPGLPQPSSEPPTTEKRMGFPQYDVVANTTMRKTIARRLTESKQLAPHFYLKVDCQIDGLLSIRAELNNKIKEGKISVNDLVIKASALALTKVPEANASWTESETLIYRSVDVSVAVAIEGGLITPIIRNAENKGLEQISLEMNDLANRAREGKLAPEEYQGGTFSISNLGMYGVKEFSAVINPPQGAILAVGAGEDRPVVKSGAITIAKIMTCTLSVDHRVVDGAVGAKFLAEFKNLIEDPIRMLL